MPKRKLDPLPAAAFQILLALAEGDLHGYAIMRQVGGADGGGRCGSGPGTLYSSIHALLSKRDCIEEVDPGAAPELSDALPAERRRSYHLTTAGKQGRPPRGGKAC